ncbi:cell division transport system permease protein [Sphingorhabdus rigui]|uniref:Cell division transport system permease protein n=1 Tax=Sphingorhabdus rigui TaxID=1282858 RepID=A0A840AZ80_9SPHN|nr:cell division protein [Sphingorhabdus rigui]MBB3943699.1 cell division transport system permease protein [Sphingorhabdus rigui]
MLLDFVLPAHDRKLIPEGRLSGPMPWVIAIMLFLTLLVAAGGLTLAEAARQGGQDLARQVTVQIIESDPAQRAAQRAAVTRALRKLDSIAEVKPVPDAQVRALLEPWLGTGVIDADVPVPALVDVRFASVPTAETITRLQSTLRSVAPNIRVDSHSSWMAPFFELMRALLWLAAAVFLLLLVATSAVVILAVRSTLNTHRETIEIMHMMGGTDVQAARLFQRRVALDALLGGAVGFIVAAVVIVTVGDRFAAVEPGLLSGAHFPYYGWAILALIPLAVMALAMLMARMTVISALKRIL